MTYTEAMNATYKELYEANAAIDEFIARKEKALKEAKQKEKEERKKLKAKGIKR